MVSSSELAPVTKIPPYRAGDRRQGRARGTGHALGFALLDDGRADLLGRVDELNTAKRGDREHDPGVALRWIECQIDRRTGGLLDRQRVAVDDARREVASVIPLNSMRPPPPSPSIWPGEHGGGQRQQAGAGEADGCSRGDAAAHGQRAAVTDQDLAR